MNDETRERLAVILVKERHNGIMAFLVQDPSCPNPRKDGWDNWYTFLDESSRQWNLLTESEKTSWDILVELQGGWRKVVEAHKRENQ